MSMIQRATVVGAKKFKGEIDGRSFDTCKVRVLIQVPSESENEAGFNVSEFNYGKSSNYDGLKNFGFPFEADLQLEFELRSGNPQMTLKNLRPVEEKPIK